MLKSTLLLIIFLKSICFNFGQNSKVELKFPHTYALNMEKNLGKTLRIEFATSGNELDCKILKRDNYEKGSEEVYSDYEEFNIQREYHMGKRYIYVSQSKDEKTKFNDLIISIFSTNPGHIAGLEPTKLAYTIRYTTESNIKKLEKNLIKNLPDFS